MTNSLAVLDPHGAHLDPHWESIGPLESLEEGRGGGTRGHSGRGVGCACVSTALQPAAALCCAVRRGDEVTGDGRWDGRWGHGLTGDGMCVVGISLVSAGFWVCEPLIAWVPWVFLYFDNRYVSLRIRN